MNAMHTCPDTLNLQAIKPLTAVSMLALLNTMKGALPPNSMEHFFTVPAACSNRICQNGIQLTIVSVPTSKSI